MQRNIKPQIRLGEHFQAVIPPLAEVKPKPAKEPSAREGGRGGALVPSVALVLASVKGPEKAAADALPLDAKMDPTESIGELHSLPADWGCSLSEHVSAGVHSIGHLLQRRCLQLTPVMFGVWEVHMWALHRTAGLIGFKVWHWLHAGVRTTVSCLQYWLGYFVLVVIVVPVNIQQLLPCIPHNNRA